MAKTHLNRQHTRGRACRNRPRPRRPSQQQHARPSQDGRGRRHISAHAAVCIWILPVLACDSVPARALPKAKRYGRFVFAKPKDWRMPRCPRARDACGAWSPVYYPPIRYSLASVMCQTLRAKGGGLSTTTSRPPSAKTFVRCYSRPRGG